MSKKKLTQTNLDFALALASVFVLSPKINLDDKQAQYSGYQSHIFVTMWQRACKKSVPGAQKQDF